MAKRPMSRNLIGLLVSAGIVVAAPLIGLLVTILFVRGAFSSTASAAPTEKARILAEGISEAMNGTAFGIVISLVALIPSVVFAVRLVRERRSAPAAAPRSPPAD